MRVPIAIIGAGRLGTALTKALYAKGWELSDLFSRRLQKARDLATDKTKAIDSLKALSGRAGIYLLAVPDDAIEEVAGSLGDMGPGVIVAHCSGSASMDRLRACGSRIGVFYPVQTFSGSGGEDFSRIPLALSAKDPDVLETLEDLAQSLGAPTYRIDDADRVHLHLAAVMANNFSNHFYGLAMDVLKAKGLSEELIRPLILQTAAGVMQGNPHERQTGPAVRGDKHTILYHMELLSEHPRLAELYQRMTHSIEHIRRQMDKDKVKER